MTTRREIEAVVRDLIKRILAPNYKFDFDGDLRSVLGMRNWIALAAAINKDHWLKKRQLKISKTEMQEASTIADVAKIIFANSLASKQGGSRIVKRGKKRRQGSSGRARAAKKVKAKAKKTRTKNTSKQKQGSRIVAKYLGRTNKSVPDSGAFSSVVYKRTVALSEDRAEENVDAEYLVWYGTNRVPIKVNGSIVDYSSDRDNMTHFGRCRVFVPKSHQIGSTGSSVWKRILTMTDDRLKLLSVNEFQEAEFWKGIAKKLKSVTDDDGHAVVFLHGFNVSFKDAALRAAQVGFDLSIRGAMAFFSWPSQGTVDGYLADGATIEVSEDAMSEFLTSFALKSGAKSVHIIAHSMGNRGLLRAVQRIAAQAQQASGIKFDQVILAAPDVDAGLFKQLCVAYAKIARRTTLYVSEKDRAVELSRFLHQFDRVGYAPPIFVAPGIDTINVTGIDFSMLGHGFVAEARGVLADIHDLIKNGSPPGMRFGLREAIVGSDKYWNIGR